MTVRKRSPYKGHCWRSRSAPVYLYDRDRGLINATTGVLALVEALRQAWCEVEELCRQQSNTERT
jgi:hypothetical protein